MKRGRPLCPFCGEVHRGTLLRFRSQYCCHHCRKKLLDDEKQQRDVNVWLKEQRKECEKAVAAAIATEMEKRRALPIRYMRPEETNVLPRNQMPFETSHDLVSKMNSPYTLLHGLAMLVKIGERWEP